ncbi:MAG TPA: Crp/Fnr family transcriptional regulator [Burkholderiales bacterium]|nr:Crp/Fnr family transcriptional regulator [Burkholderiales bacterium]
MSTNRDVIESFLGTLPLFGGLKRGEIRRLGRGATECAIPRGTVLFRQGDPCTRLHLISKGQIKIYIQTPHGEEKVIELVGSGGCLGETALFLDEAYIASAEAIIDTTLVHLSKEAVLQQLRRGPEFSRNMLRDVCRRLAQRTHDLEHCLLFNGTQRVAAFILNQLPPNGMAGKQAAVTLPTKKSIIASRLNLTQEHFSRILRDIQTAGLIEVSGRQIRLVDVARLRNYPRPRERAPRTQK